MKNDAALRVVIDVSSIPYGRGVSRYTSNLVNALSLLPNTRLSVVGYSLRQFSALEAWGSTLSTRVDQHFWRLPPALLHGLWARAALPRARWLAGDFDVFHAWDWQLAPVGSRAQVVTIHDLAYKLFPENVPANLAGQYDRLLQTLEEKTEYQVIAVSESTKQDIINLTSIAPERIHVVYEALPQEAEYQPSQEEVETMKSKYGLTRPFWLTVGTTEPRKNLKRVIDAWKTCRSEYDLVIAGAPGWDDLPQDEGIHHLGYVAKGELASLYQSAACLAYPSLYEGFGLPILEAYFHGCPVVTSKVSSMPEVAGAAAELVDPYNVAEIAVACQKVSEEPAAAKKARREKMKHQLSKFTWEKAAEQTRTVYQKAREARQA